MYFTLALSAATREQCTALVDRAQATEPRVMPIPGPATLAWRSADGLTALLHWGRPDEGPGAGRAGKDNPLASRAGTIWVEPTAEVYRAPLRACTSLTRVDPVYVAELPGAVIVSDRALWAASAAGRLGDPDPLHLCALLGGPGYPVGTATPFAGVRAADGATSLEALGGSLLERPAAVGEAPDRPGGAAQVAAALIEAVAPLRSAAGPVELSLTGGKDSRLVAAALVAAGVPVRAKTHGFAQHPDVVVAAEVARLLGIEHEVRTPATPEATIDVATRLRATVLVADGMLSAFENVGRPDHSPSPAFTAGGHGGELLRGGYAETAAGGRYRHGATAYAKRTARATELLRRLTTGHVALLRPGAAAAYLASLRPWSATALSRGPLLALDDFYLVNRAGRWSAAARQAYLLRENLVQPLFDDGVVRAARAVPLADRVSGELQKAVLRELCGDGWAGEESLAGEKSFPSLADLPYAGKPAKGSVPETFDWRRQYGDQVARFLRDYTLDNGTIGDLFEVVSRAAAEKALAVPQADRGIAWALATMACLASGDFRNAREPAPSLTVA